MKNFLILALIPIFLLSCRPDKKLAELSVSSYNMYLFYDGYENGYEYEPFSEKNGYTEDVYKARVKKTSQYIMKHMGSSSVILFQEIENSGVLKDILDSGLKRSGFRYYGAFTDEGNLSIGYISKYPPLSSNVHKAGKSRPILELVFSIEGEELSIFTLHAASRLNEGGESERFELFSLLSELLELNSGRLRIAIGDFNVEINDGESSIASDDCSLALSAAIVATKDTRISEGIYHSPMLVPGEMNENGTYFYQGKWSYLDNVLLSHEAFDMKGWEYHKCEVIAPFESKDSHGYPKRFDIKSSNGFSDHFAINLILRYN